MLAFLFDSGFSPPVAAALWCTVAAVLASILLLLYTIELRIRRRFSESRRARAVSQWRTIIAGAMVSPDEIAPVELPRIGFGSRKDFLWLWNHTRNMVEGEAADRLNELLRRLNIIEWVRHQTRHSHLGTRLLAIQTLGYLKDHDSWDLILAACDDERMAISITAAEALADIDPARAVLILIPKITERRDWPKTHVFRLLQKAGSEAVSEPLYRAIRTGSAADAAYLMQFAVLAEFDVRDAIAAETMATRNDPNALAAAMKISSGYGRTPRLHALAQHRVRYVRMQAARLLGRTGRPEDLQLLEQMLTDKEWWVRYRAALALVRMPDIGSAELAAMRARQDDPYARDILEQAIAEVRRK